MKKKIFFKKMVAITALSSTLAFSATPILGSMAYAAEQTQDLEVRSVQYEDGVITFTMNLSIDQSEGLWRIIDSSGAPISFSADGGNTVNLNVAKLTEGQDYYITTTYYNLNVNKDVNINSLISRILNATPIIENISPIDSLSTTITGTSNPGGAVQLLDGSGKILGEAVADSTGLFKIEFESQSYKSVLTVKATTSVGFITEEISVNSVTDLAAPKVNEISHSDTTVTGKAIPGAQVLVQTDNHGSYSTLANSDGSFSVNTIGGLKYTDKIQVFYYYDGFKSEIATVAVN